MVRGNEVGYCPRLRVGDGRNQGAEVRLEVLGKCGDMLAEGLAAARRGPVFQRLQARATIETVHGTPPRVCDRMRTAAVGAQTERSGLAVAGEGFAWRQDLTGRFAFVRQQAGLRGVAMAAIVVAVVMANKRPDAATGCDTLLQPLHGGPESRPLLLLSAELLVLLLLIFARLHRNLIS